MTKRVISAIIMVVIFVPFLLIGRSGRKVRRIFGKCGSE